MVSDDLSFVYGSNQPAVQPDGNKPDGGLTSVDKLVRGAVHDAEFQSGAKELLTCGKTRRDLLMRGIFKDQIVMNKFLKYCAKVKFCKMDNSYLERAEEWFIVQLSLNGMARREYLQAAVGVVAPELYGYRGKERRRFFKLPWSKDKDKVPTVD